MGISKEEAIKELQNRETVFVAYSQATKLPYVKCDEETYNDQAWIFSTEEGIKEFGKKMIEDKILLMGMKYEKKDYPNSALVNLLSWGKSYQASQERLSKIIWYFLCHWC